MNKKRNYISLLKCVKADIIKLKNSSLMFVSLFGATFIPLLVFSMYFFNYTHFIPQPKVNPWFQLINSSLNNISIFILPFYIILATSLVHNIEHKSDSWKNLLCLPHSKLNLYLSKLFILIVSIIATYLLFMITIVVTGLILYQIHNNLQLNFTEIPFNYLFLFLIHSFISILGILALHNAMSLLVRNQVIIIGIGLMFTIVATLLFMHEKMIFFPYSFPILTLHDLIGNIQAKKIGNISIHEIYSVFYFLLFSVLGLIIFSNKDLK